MFPQQKDGPNYIDHPRNKDCIQIKEQVILIPLPFMLEDNYFLLSRLNKKLNQVELGKYGRGKVQHLPKSDFIYPPRNIRV